MTHLTNHSYDVIVVGAGPAGATLAYELSRKNLNILVLEKEPIPRYKACAGGVTVRAATLLGMDFGSITRDVIHGATVIYKGRHIFTKSYPQPLIYTVMRDEFDQLLVQRAREAGATVVDNERVCRVRTTKHGTIVETANNVFSAQIVAGADGAMSIVAADTGLMQDVDLGIGLVAEIPISAQKMVQWENIIGLSLGHVRGGYGWVFPKKDHLSVGIGSALSQAKRLKSGYQAVLNSHGLRNHSASKIRSHRLPVRKKGTAIHSERCLLLGDAAGLVDPVSGEGIHNAVKSARIAASVIYKCLENNTVNLEEYELAVDKEIMPELRAARALARVYTWFPGLVFDAVESSDRIWNACCRLLRGEETYLTLKRRLGPAKVLFDLISI